jgi:hypothetical protein
VAADLRTQTCIQLSPHTIQLDYYRITTSAAATDGGTKNGHDGHNNVQRSQIADFARRWAGLQVLTD